MRLRCLYSFDDTRIDVVTRPYLLLVTRKLAVAGP